MGASTKGLQLGQPKGLGSKRRTVLWKMYDAHVIYRPAAVNKTLPSEAPQDVHGLQQARARACWSIRGGSLLGFQPEGV